MRTTSCSTCGQTRSVRIKACPTCEDIATDGDRTRLRVAAILPALFATVVFGAEFVPLPKPAEANAVASVWDASTSFGEGASCEKTLACIGDRHNAAAMEACTIAIWAARSGDMEWTSGYAEPRFAEYGWTSGDAASLTYSGWSGRTHDQNGRWTQLAYECDYDTAMGRVTAVRFQ